MTFFTFLIVFSLGLLLIRYRENVQRFTGNFEWAERTFGSGGTFSMLLLIGIGMCFFSILYVTGSLDGLVEGTLGRFFPRSR